MIRIGILYALFSIILLSVIASSLSITINEPIAIVRFWGKITRDGEGLKFKALIVNDNESYCLYSNSLRIKVNMERIVGYYLSIYGAIHLVNYSTPSNMTLDDYLAYFENMNCSGREKIVWINLTLDTTVLSSINFKYILDGEPYVDITVLFIGDQVHLNLTVKELRKDIWRNIVDELRLKYRKTTMVGLTWDEREVMEYINITPISVIPKVEHMGDRDNLFVIAKYYVGNIEPAKVLSSAIEKAYSGGPSKIEASIGRRCGCSWDLALLPLVLFIVAILLLVSYGLEPSPVI